MYSLLLKLVLMKMGNKCCLFITMLYIKYNMKGEGQYEREKIIW